MADPGKGKGEQNNSSAAAGNKAGKGGKGGKAKNPATSVTFKSIDIKGHAPINVHPAAQIRPLVVRAKLEAKRNGGTVPVTITAALDQFTAKHGTPTTIPALTWNVDAAGAVVKAVPLAASKVKRNEIEFRGSYTFAAGAVAAGQTAFVCLNTAEVTATTNPAVTVTTAKKVTKKLAGGDCVRIINVDPSLTKADD